MWIALLLSAVAPDPAPPGVTPRPSLKTVVRVGPMTVAPQEVYVRPVVPPYEPPSDFGRKTVEGDAVGRSGRGAGRPDAEADYLTAVAARRDQAQALMGPLDGLWRVTDADGRHLLDLSLTDRGPGRSLDGVWLGRTPSGAPRSTPVTVLSRTDDRVRIGLGEHLTLDLTRGPDGWRGDLSEAGERRAAILRPIGG